MGRVRRDAVGPEVAPSTAGADRSPLAHRPDGVAEILHLQATGGNAMVARLLGAGLGSATSSDELTARIRSQRGRGEPLAGELRAEAEASLDADLGAVRLHRDSEAASLAGDLGARAFTTGQDVFFGQSTYDPLSRVGYELLSHELVHTVQQGAGPVEGRPAGAGLSVSSPQDRDERAATAAARRAAASRNAGGVGGAASADRPGGSAGGGTTTVQRDPLDVTRMSISPAYAQGLSDADLAASIGALRGRPEPGDVDNLAVLLDELAQRQLSTAAMPEGDIDPTSASFQGYQATVAELVGIGRNPAGDLEVVVIPSDRVMVADADGMVSLMDPQTLVGIGDDLLPVLDALAEGAPVGGAPEHQLALWPDGRALLAPAVSMDAASLLLQSQPVQIDGFLAAHSSSPGWNRVRDASLAGVFRSGIYQLGTFPVSKFMGRTLPPGSRIRFANPAWPNQWKFKPGLPRDTRLFEVFQPGTNKFFAWDAHATPPGAKTPHPYYHVNQKGMHGVFGASDIAPVAAADLPAARGLRYARVGTRFFLIVGVAVDAYSLGNAAARSVEEGSAAPVAAQAIRVVGGWGGAWAGAKLACAGGALATVETGPGAALGCIVGGGIGAFAGYFGADWIADLISED